MKKHYSLFQKQKQEISRKGYTLIELLVVILLLVVVETLIAGILNSTITGIAKSRLSNDLGQNGNYALSLITDMVLNAQDLKSVTDESQTTSLSCTPAGIIAKSIKLEGFDGGVTTLTCDDIGLAPTYTISSTSASLVSTTTRTSSLLDTSRVKLVPGSCKFTCFQADEYSAPRIDVFFKLSNITDSASVDTVTFNTSLSMRNLSIK